MGSGRRATMLHAGLALILGALTALSFEPITSPTIQLTSLSLFYALLWHTAGKGATVRLAAGLGFSFGMGCFSVGVSWLYISMHDYGGMSAPLAVAAVLLFSAYLSAFGALACALAVTCWRHSRPWIAVLAGASAWALTEWLRGVLFTGFPWLSIGYAQIDGVFAPIAPWLGVHGVSLFTILCAAALGLVLARLPRPGPTRLITSLGCAALALGASLLASTGSPKTSDGPTIRVRLLQGNIPQNLKFDPIRSERAMRDYVGAVDGARTHLTVLPETAWTIPWQQTPRELALELLKKVEMTGGVIAIGKPIVDSESNQDRRNPSITNGIGVFDSSGRQVSRYDKRHLVPFGEFVPWGFRWFVNLMNIPLGEFRRGAREQALLTIGPERIAFNICYEDLFGDELAEQVRQGATLLINATNIGWFGQSHALGQHLQIARMRSLELARPMLRATNTGVTAAIDHRGRVLAQIPAHQPGSLIVDVRGQTAMTLFGRWGHIPLLGLSMVFALIALAGLRSAGGSERNR